MPRARVRGQFVEESGGEPIRILCLQVSVSVTPAIRLAISGEVSRAGYQLRRRGVGKEGQEGAQQQFARRRSAGEASKDDDEEVAKLPS